MDEFAGHRTMAPYDGRGLTRICAAEHRQGNRVIEFRGKPFYIVGSPFGRNCVARERARTRRSRRPRTARTRRIAVDGDSDDGPPAPASSAHLICCTSRVALKLGLNYQPPTCGRVSSAGLQSSIHQRSLRVL